MCHKCKFCLSPWTIKKDIPLCLSLCNIWYVNVKYGSLKELQYFCDGYNWNSFFFLLPFFKKVHFQIWPHIEYLPGTFCGLSLELPPSLRSRYCYLHFKDEGGTGSDWLGDLSEVGELAESKHSHSCSLRIKRSGILTVFPEAEFWKK